MYISINHEVLIAVAVTLKYPLVCEFVSLHENVSRLQVSVYTK